MTKQEAITLFGGGSAGIARLAAVLKITRHAVYQWRDPIPLLREMQINRLSPTPRKPRQKATQPSSIP